MKESREKNQPSLESKNILYLLWRLFNFVDKRRKVQGVILLALTLLGAVAEIISLGAVVPFISVLVEPDNIFYSEYMAGFNAQFNINTPPDLILPLLTMVTAEPTNIESPPTLPADPPLPYILPLFVIVIAPLALAGTLIA